MNAPDAPRTARRALTAIVVLLTFFAVTATSAWAASGNASAAAGFIEDAQNDDGGFGPERGERSQPTASAWAALALLAAGKHPRDQVVKGGTTLDGYLKAQRDRFTSTEQLALLALVQGASGATRGRYRDPAGAVAARLTPDAIRRDPRGAALGVLGLLAAGEDADRQAAAAAATALRDLALEDGGWGAGQSDSESTALVLLALAKSGAAKAGDPPVDRGIEHLRQAQANDGSIAASVRTDQAFAGGSVGATAFAIQALSALGRPTLKTPTGRTLRQGLTQYQQRTSGGLSSTGSVYDTGFDPSVVETAQAFPAFNGDTFPLAVVAAKPRSAKPEDEDDGDAKDGAGKQVSSGTARQGVSSTQGGRRKDAGAFQRARTGRQGTAKRGRTDRAGSAGARTKAPRAAAAGGDEVTGSVVGATSAPKLVARAGQADGGLSEETKAALGLGAGLLALLALGVVVESRRPRDGAAGPPMQIAVARGATLLGWARARGALVPAGVATVGLVLVVTPFATGMWDRAPEGDRLLDAFAPHLTAEKATRYQQDIAVLDDAVREATRKGPNALGGEARFVKATPQLQQVAETWPETHRSLRSVVDPIAAQQPSYEAVRALPSFALFPWAFLVPGALLLVLGGAAVGRPALTRPLRWAVVAVAAGMLAAPVATGMWDRAPQGADLIEAFRPIEQRKAVERVQRDFAQVALVQGAVNGELAPALRKAGLSPAQVRRRFPAARRLDRRWVAVLNGLTPVLGTMSDQVDRFQTVATLPSFRLFPWFFAVPGALLVLLVLAPLRPRLAPDLRPQPEGAP